VKCEVCDKYEATVKDYRDDGEKYRSCEWCANLSTKNWYYVMATRLEPQYWKNHPQVDPKTFYEEEDSDDD